MLIAILFLALSAQSDRSSEEIVSTAFELAPHDYIHKNVRIAHWPATVNCRMHVDLGNAVAMELIAQADLDKFVRGRRHPVLVSLSARGTAEFHQPVPEAGQYEIVLTNDGTQPSNVQLEATVQYAREPDVAKYLSPARRLAVIAISMGVFLTIVSWSAWSLIGAIRRT